MQIKVEKPSQQYLNDRKVSSWAIWEKEVSRFDWHYDDTEECYILEGDVVVETEDGKRVQFGKGDFVTFPKGLSCVWDIKKPVRKHYMTILKRIRMKNEPNGFQGIEWGTRYDTIDDMAIFERSEKYKHIKAERRNDIKKIGEARIDSILYYFFGNNFYFVEVITRGWENSQSLLNYSISTYGDNFKVEDFTAPPTKIYYWEGEDVKIRAKYSGTDGAMMWCLWYKPLEREFRKYEEKVMKGIIEHEKEVAKFTLPKPQKEGCFIATLIYGDKSLEVTILRHWRDNHLLRYRIGREFTKFYYKISPVVASKIATKEPLKKVLRLLLDNLVEIIKKDVK